MTATLAQNISLSQYPWHFKERGAESWTTCSTFPTVVQHELRSLGQLPDEAVEFNERLIQWVGTKDWLFTTSFPTPDDVAKHGLVRLVFDGLDTIATVKLNGKIILKCNNMFVPECVDVKNHLAEAGEENTLEILFDSATRVALQREKDYGKTFINIRETSRMYVRKAQFQWGWDWGPAMITAGPYKDIRLELSTAKYTDLHVEVGLREDFKTAYLNIHAEVAGATSQTYIRYQYHEPTDIDTGSGCEKGVKLSGAIQCNANQSTYEHKIPLKNPLLWWPVGHGKQHFYEARAQLHDASGAVLDTYTVRFGIRKVELIQYPLKSDSGTTFYFRVNGRPVFCKGTNWVPPNSMYNRITPELYRRWLDLALENNNNMIRVWGGGWYEGDAFYDYCDKKGIMIWHDMMFACGIYPTTESFHASVKREIAAQAKRLRRHPCMTLYCGDNEFYFMADRQYKPYDPEETGDWKSYPERKLYFDTIPSVLKQLTPEVPYWPSSPFGGNPANNLKQGDVHQWSVWHNEEYHYQTYPQLGGRFVSEFGLHGFPDLRTVRMFAPNADTRYPNSRVMDVHNKSSGSETKLGKYLWANLRINTWRKGDTGMADFIYCSQLLQAEALTYACRSWRRGWKGSGREESAGVLIWQLNDIYPVTSWSLVDSEFRRKPAFYTTKRDFAPIAVGVARDPVWLFVNEDTRGDWTTNVPTFNVYGSNLEQEDKTVEVKCRMYDWARHQEVDLAKAVAKKTFTLKANQSTELFKMETPRDKESGVTEDSLIVFLVTLHDDETGAEISRHVSWPEPYRYLLTSEDTHVGAEVSTVTNSKKGDDNVDTVTLSCGPTPAKGVLAYVDPDDGEDGTWSDNMVDLMPGEKCKLKVKGLKGRKVKTRWLYCWEQESYTEQ